MLTLKDCTLNSRKTKIETIHRQIKNKYILLPKATEEMTPDFLGRVFEDLLLRKSFDLVFITSVVGEMICIKGHNELIAIQTILNNQETIKIKSVFEELNDKTFFEIGYFNINKAIDTETYVQYFDPGVSLDFIKSRYDLSIPNEILDEFNKKENKTILTPFIHSFD